jgi:hypothetical protein
LNLAELLDLVLEKTGYKKYTLESADGEERWDNILELRTVAAGYKDLEPREALAAFLEEVALVSDVDELDEKVEAVTLITLHQAKGSLPRHPVEVRGARQFKARLSTTLWKWPAGSTVDYNNTVFHNK